MTKKTFCTILTVAFLLAGIHAVAPAAAAMDRDNHEVLILDYHRFNTVQTDSMTVVMSAFEFQLQYLKSHGYHFIPLSRYVDYRMGKAPAPPPRSVVVTMDDGSESVYAHALPLIERYRIPVTLFIYPSAISNARYAMTWNQLRKLKATGLFDIESHTYWHPNFEKDKRRLTPPQYDKDVAFQLLHSKAVLDKKLGIHVTMLAWPYGIYDRQLMQMAKAAGYKAAFALTGRHAGDFDSLMAIPRYLVSDRDRGSYFSNILQGTPARREATASLQHIKKR